MHVVLIDNLGYVLFLTYYLEKESIPLQRGYVEDVISLGGYNSPIGRGS
jgi:hypothetical protein